MPATGRRRRRGAGGGLRLWLLLRFRGRRLRLVDRLLAQVGRILELDGPGVVTREVVEAAREVLVIGTA